MNPAQQSSLQVNISHKQILGIALPIAASIVVPQINFIINNIFLSGLGQRELGVAGITGVYYLVFAVIGMGFNSGLQTLISRRAGQNDEKGIGIVFTQAFRLVMIMSVLGIGLTYLVAPTVLGWAMSDTSNVDLAVDFLKIRIWGLPFLFIYQMRNGLLVGINQTKLLVLGTATEAIINVVFDYGLIYGKLGMPELGFNGAAYASILSEVAGLGVIYWIIKAKGIQKRFALLKDLKYDATATKTLLVQSSPLIAQHAISIISWEFFYILIEHHGATDLAISNIMRNIFGFFGCFTWAFASTTNTMVSNVIGQEQSNVVPKLIWRIIRWSTGFAFGVALFLNLFPELWLNIYGQDDEFIQRAIPVLRVVSGALIVMSFSVVWMNAVVGSCNPRIALYAEMGAILLYCLYVYFVLEVWNMSIVWGWGSEWIYWISLLVPCFWYMNTSKWKGKKV